MEFSQAAGRYAACRYSMTGAFGYEFYCEGKQIGSASSFPLPSPPVMLQCGQLELCSDFDLATTIVPGIARTIRTADGIRTVATLTYQGTNEYRLTTDGDDLRICAEPDGWLVYRKDARIAELRRTQGTGETVRTGAQEREKYFDLATEEALSPELAVLLLSFPMLQFAF